VDQEEATHIEMSDPRKWKWPFGQHWNKIPEPRFQPGFVEFTQTDSDLLIEASLQDHAMNLSRYPLNYPAFLECDAFEAFLGAEGAGHYYEFHVTPSNSILQLRFEIGGERGDLVNHLVQEKLFSSHVLLQDSSWNVELCVPLSALGFPPSPCLRLSFGRYDYSADGGQPVISSTSPHQVCNFHRIEEWQVVDFKKCSS
jgi:hypothetical protein